MTDHRRARFEYPGTGPSRWPANSSFKSKGCEAVSLYALMLLFSTGILVGVEHPSGDHGLVPKLVEVEKQIGLSFTHINGAEGNRFIVETLGSGGGFLDFDNDGWQDIYLIQSGARDADARPPNRLFRNRGDGTFSQVTGSGTEDTAYGIGCTFGDYDNDGWTDIYVTNFGPNRLFHNRGDGTFEDVSRRAGVDDPGLSSSAAFADVNSDGWLDLYVGNYLRFSYEGKKDCRFHDVPVICPPGAYEAEENSFYLNLGNGSFRRANSEQGLVPRQPAASKTLGVLFFDMDNDGDQDLYVSNHATPNFLFENQGKGRFEDVSLLSGTAYNLDGETEAGMGVDAADLDGNGHFDLLVAHFDTETNTLYMNEGEGMFSDHSEISGIAAASRTLVGFGVSFFDLNNSGTPDLFVANGHVSDNIQEVTPSYTYPQPNLLLVNLGKARFSDVSTDAGPALTREEVSRGTAVADFDRDGDLDLLVTTNNGPARLLQNRFNDEKTTHSWVQFVLQGIHCNRNAIGARMRLTAGSITQEREVRSGSSYASQSELVVHFGLGIEKSVNQLEVRWPCGKTRHIESPELNRRHEIKEVSDAIAP